ncbi:DUF4236 domain-containing protein [Streptomyces sp. NPDC001852]|uniref:DUF4236 domain-containing protein n=1 Tax=Streptomyces sp. NPDC001852 TaxID=3364619 RepID=UPI00367E3330
MGFSYRKSFKAGPFRVTASKSGISYSAGVKGVRVTKRANGRLQTTISAPGTGLRYTTSSSGKRRGAAARATAVDAVATTSPPARHERRERRPGGWYFVIVLLSAGLFSAVPFAHAAARLGRRDLRLRAGIHAAVAAVLGVLTSITPQDAQGNPVGTAGHALSTIFGLLALALMVTACFQLVPLRREVYGLDAGPTPPPHPAAADPVVAAHLAARARRDEARALAQSDPVLAYDLRIGRPDLPRQYDDGGLIDLNSAPAQAIATACSIESSLAERIVEARQELGSFSSLDEVIVFAEVEQGAVARIRDYALLLPR